MGGELVLIVDDNATNLKLLAFVLASKGYDVRTADSAEAALRVLGVFFPRIILMDLQLPGVDGFELTRRLKADPATCDILIVAVTAFAMKGDQARAIAAGCDGYISKPIDTRALPRVIAEHLQRAGEPPGSTPTQAIDE